MEIIGKGVTSVKDELDVNGKDSSRSSINCNGRYPECVKYHPSMESHIPMRNAFPQARPFYQPPKAMIPHKGMIRLTSLKDELRRPTQIFQSCLYQPRKRTKNQTKEYKDGKVEISPRYREKVSRTQYHPESLQFFGKQLTMVDLTQTVDSFIESSVVEMNQREAPGMPDIHKLDRELTLLTVSNIRNIGLPRRKSNFSKMSSFKT